MLMLMRISLSDFYVADGNCYQVSIYCSPCSLQYTRILHSETIQVQNTTNTIITTTFTIIITIITHPLCCLFGYIWMLALIWDPTRLQMISPENTRPLHSLQSVANVATMICKYLSNHFAGR